MLPVSRARAAEPNSVGGVGRRGVVGATIVLAVLALAYPAVAPAELDSLPFSNYPMFAHPRGRVTEFNLVVWLDPDGNEHRLDLRAVGGTDQPIQASETVRQAVRRGEADDLCTEIARGLDRSGVVRVVTVAYDAVGWYEGRRAPVRHSVHAECPADGSS